MLVYIKGIKSVTVPVLELQKLEQARIELYTYLTNRLTGEEIMALPTEQIWKVANTKNWEYNDK